MTPSKPKAAQRVTLTQSQATTGSAIRLIQKCEAWLSDGEISQGEFLELQQFLADCDEKEIPAFKFLSEEIARYMEDGEVQPWELNRIRKSLLRVIPKHEREKADAIYRVRSEAKYHEHAAERDAFYAARSEQWASMRERKMDDWSTEPATEKQLDYLRDLGAEPSALLSKYEASCLIDEMLNHDEPLRTPSEQSKIDDEIQSIVMPDYLKSRNSLTSKSIKIHRPNFFQRVVSLLRGN
ncbi:MAG: hypothetical protein H2172_11610 [Opitutus sp.]|nr:hypothetical protein [Opitutus sp.]MCS6276994.1 hypothetical protein [Opitutus sp.]MCS6299958.1 hypothetical protein [Opitutus sp.]